MKKGYYIKIGLTEEEYLGVAKYLQEDSDTTITREDISDYVENEVIRPALHDPHNAVSDDIIRREKESENSDWKQIIFGNEGFINMSGNYWTTIEFDYKPYNSDNNSFKIFGEGTKKEFINSNKIIDVHKITDGLWKGNYRGRININNVNPVRQQLENTMSENIKKF